MCLRCRRHDLGHGGVADAACGAVDGALQCLLVVRIDHHTEIGNDVLDFLALIERQSAIHTIRDAALAHRLLEDAALCVRAVQHREVGVRHAVPRVHRRYASGNDLALLDVADRTHHGYGIALFALRIDILLYLHLVLADETVCCTDDVLCGAVVLLQLEHPCALECPCEVEYVVYVRTAKGVDALCVVADHADVLVLSCQLRHDAVLCVVGVLILVNQYVAELLPVLRQDVVLVGVEEPVGIEQQVVEVHGVGLTAPLEVLAVDVRQQRHAVALVGHPYGCTRGIVAREHQAVLGVRNLVLHGGGAIDLVVKTHAPDDALQEAAAVRRVVYGELRREAYAAALGVEDAQEHGVERPHPQVACALSAHLTADALLHLAGGLVCECQRQNAPRLIAMLQQPCNLVGQHPRLARACSGDDQRGAVTVGHGLALALIEFVYVVRHRMCCSAVPSYFCPSSTNARRPSAASAAVMRRHPLSRSTST